MTRTLALTFCSAFVLAGCPTRPGGDSQPGGDTQPGPPAGGESQPGPPTPLPTLQIVSPASNIWTNGTIAITVKAEGGPAPAQITLIADGVALGNLPGPAPFNGTWDTKNASEGPHALVAEANVGGKLISSAPVTIIVDRTAPTIVSTMPSTGAANVVLRAPVEVTFSEPMLALSFTPSAVSLQIDGVAVAIKTTLSTDGTKAAIAINDLTAFALPATFSVTLATSITDLAGNALSVPVAAWSWSVPDWIKYAPLFSYHPPQLAVGPNFQPVVASTGCVANSSAGCVYPLSVASNDGHSWSSVGQLNNVFGPGSLDLDAQGNPIVAGTGRDPASGKSTVIVTAWNGTSWGSSIAPLPNDDAFAFASPIVHLDPSGRPVVAWIEGRSSTQSDVAVARWTGTQWDRSLGSVGLSAVTSHALTFDGSGNPIVGWNRAGYLSGFSSWNGTAWMSAWNSVYTNEPFVALDQALDPIMVSQEPSNNAVEHYANGTWSQAIAAPIPAGGNFQSPHLAVTPDHQPVVAWVDTTAPAKIGLARWNGSLWEARAGLFNAIYGVTNQPPTIVVDSRGSIWLAWMENLTVNVWMSNY